MMAYTLAMAETKGIQIAHDGVAHVSMTDARAFLTRLIRTVLEDHRVGAFTERGARRAYVVEPAFYDRAALDRLKVETLVATIDKIPEAVRDEPWAREILAVRGTVMDTG